jgi:hypothetical protein
VIFDLIATSLLARTLDRGLGDQNGGGTNLEFAAQAFELAGTSEPLSLEDDRAADSVTGPSVANSSKT